MSEYRLLVGALSLSCFVCQLSAIPSWSACLSVCGEDDDDGHTKDDGDDGDDDEFLSLSLSLFHGLSLPDRKSVV